MLKHGPREPSQSVSQFSPSKVGRAWVDDGSLLGQAGRQANKQAGIVGLVMHVQVGHDEIDGSLDRWL